MTESDERLRFEREKWDYERDLKARELALRETEQTRASWRSPLVVAIATAAVAGLTNAGIAWHNGRQQIELEDRKAEAARILEVIKIPDAAGVRNNLSFLLEAGLIADAERRDQLSRYLADTPNDRIPRLPSVIEPAGAGGRQLHLVAIGVSDYGEGTSGLQFPDDDATAIAAVAVAQRGGLYESVSTQVILNAEATRAAILDAVAQLGRRASAARGDVAMIFFAGHAALDESRAVVIVPHEGMKGGIRLAELRDILLPLIGSTYVLVVIDACPGGGDASMTKALDALGMTVAVGGKPGTLCFDMPDLSHGSFTAGLLRGIAGGADKDGDGTIWVSELLGYAETEVAAKTEGKQVPESVVGFDGPILTVDPSADDTVKAAATASNEPSTVSSQ
jgi:hypothetical protein